MRRWFMQVLSQNNFSHSQILLFHFLGDTNIIQYVVLTIRNSNSSSINSICSLEYFMQFELRIRKYTNCMLSKLFVTID